MNAISDESDLPHLILFPCQLNKAFGTAFCDDGAMNNYISLKYAKQAKLCIQPTMGQVRMANGMSMRKYGTVKFPLHIGEWHGIVKAIVLNLNEFDVILGMLWHHQWKPQIDWDVLDMEIDTDRGVK